MVGGHNLSELCRRWDSNWLDAIIPRDYVLHSKVILSASSLILLHYIPYYIHTWIHSTFSTQPVVAFIGSSSVIITWKMLRHVTGMCNTNITHTFSFAPISVVDASLLHHPSSAMLVLITKDNIYCSILPATLPLPNRSIVIIIIAYRARTRFSNRPRPFRLIRPSTWLWELIVRSLLFVRQTL